MSEHAVSIEPPLRKRASHKSEYRQRPEGGGRSHGQDSAEMHRKHHRKPGDIAVGRPSSEAGEETVKHAMLGGGHGSTFRKRSHWLPWSKRLTWPRGGRMHGCLLVDRIVPILRLCKGTVQFYTYGQLLNLVNILESPL
jgi:hypothetical protein